MRFGAFVTGPTPWPFQAPVSDATKTSTIPATPPSLYSIALKWLTEDREYRRELEKQGKKTRGARRAEVCGSAAYPVVYYLIKYAACPF